MQSASDGGGAVFGLHATGGPRKLRLVVSVFLARQVGAQDWVAKLRGLPPPPTTLDVEQIQILGMQPRVKSLRSLYLLTADVTV